MIVDKITFHWHIKKGIEKKKEKRGKKGKKGTEKYFSKLGNNTNSKSVLEDSGKYIYKGVDGDTIGRIGKREIA